MKKTLIKTFVTIFLLLSLCLGIFACGKNSFKVKDGFASKNTLTSIKQGGFALETEEFYYVINGVGDSTADNSFGSPIKGSLLAVKKDLSDSAIIVPKLFVASDYSAGIYIFDGYVYYATPSTSVELTGETKNSYLTFAKTKLDGTGYTEFATVSGISTEYRFVKSGDNVFVVYYDSEKTELVSINTKNKEKTIIAKTDDTKKESLDAYKFFDNENLDKGIVAYTTTVYKGEYIEGTSRATENYNKLYVYKVNDKNTEHTDCFGEVIKDGSKADLKDEKFSIKTISNGFVVYTVTSTFDSTGKSYIYYDETTLIPLNGELDATFVVDVDAKNYFIYTLDTTNKKIITNKYNSRKFVVDSIFADGSDVTTLLFKEGDYIYFVNSSNRLARIKNDSMLVEYISEDSIDAGWFMPTLIGDGIMYLDNSTSGASNVKYVKFENVKKDYQDDDETKDIISYHYEGQKFVAEELRLEEDIVAGCDSEIDSIASTLDKNGRITEETEKAIQKVEEEYKALSKESQELIKDCYAELEKYNDAIKLAKICEKLEGIEFYMTDANEVKTKYQEAYNEALEKFTKLEEKGNEYLNSVCNLMEGNTYYWFNYAKTNIYKAN